MSEEEPKATTPSEVAPSENTTEETTAEEFGASEEPQAYFEPVVKLNAVEVVSGEEDEDVIFKMRAKLFCFRETLLDEGSGQKSWCERGVGDVRFLKHKEMGQVRMLMRQEKTMKIIINHLVDARTELCANMGSDRAWVFSCFDFSGGEIETQIFAIRFSNSESAKLFKEAHENAKSINAAIDAGADAAETTKGDEAAEALESLKVSEKTTEETEKSE